MTFKLETNVEFNEVKTTGKKDDDKKVISGQLKVNATVDIAEVMQLYGFNISTDTVAGLFWEESSGHPKTTAKNGLTFGVKLERIAVKLYESFVESPKDELFACDDVVLSGFRAKFGEGHTFDLTFNMHCRGLTEKQQGRLSSLVKENVFMIAVERQLELPMENQEAA